MIFQSYSRCVSVHFPKEYESGYPDNHKDFYAGEVIDYPGEILGASWIEAGLVELYDGKGGSRYRSIDDPGCYNV